MLLLNISKNQRKYNHVNDFFFIYIINIYQYNFTCPWLYSAAHGVELYFNFAYNASVCSILEYETMIWTPYTSSDVQKINRMQNKLFSFVEFPPKIVHPPSDYNPVTQVPRLDSKRKSRDISQRQLYSISKNNIHF